MTRRSLVLSLPFAGASPQPTPAQRRWMDLRLGMLVCFGINTYYDAEWSDGKLDPARFNPVELDTDQWCRAARAAGMRFVLFTAKHHDGFCLWPTRYTDYSVKASPFRGDVIHSLSESCRRHGLKLGLYYSLWDRRQKSEEDDEGYARFMRNQLSELLNDYGEVVELWFDGMWTKMPKPALTGLSADGLQDVWNREGRRHWRMDATYEHIKKIQPDCLVLNNSTIPYAGVPLPPVDARTGERGTEAAKPDRKIWEIDGKTVYLPLEIETTLSQRGRKNMKRGSWYWHEWDHSVATREQIRGWIRHAREIDAVLAINAGPMASGKLRPEDEQALLALQADDGGEVWR